MPQARTSAAGRDSRGATAVEVMAVLVILLIAASMAVPDLARTVRLLRLRAAVEDLSGAVDLTRAEALARGRRVLLAPQDGADWASGWTIAADGEVLARHGRLAPGIAVRSRFSGPAPSAYLAYNGAGRPCSAASSATARWGALTLSMDGEVRHITINMLGRTRICNPQRDGASCSGADEPP